MSLPSPDSEAYERVYHVLLLTGLQSLINERIGGFGNVNSDIDQGRTGWLKPSTAKAMRNKRVFDIALLHRSQILRQYRLVNGTVGPSVHVRDQVVKMG